MTVYPEMMHWGREVMICLYCAVEWNSRLSTGLAWTKSSVLHFWIRIFVLIYCSFLSLAARLAVLQIVTDVLGLLRKPGTRQRLQLHQTSGLHARKQDLTNR